jgi:CDP-diacylglycerol--serine O-phosphatidyltransferase
MSEYDPQYVKPADPLKRRRGIYILPNLFTTASLFAGFYAIVQAMNNRFGAAAAAIFIAMVFDGLDGRVARLTRTQSDFGAEFDSLSDMVAFGAAPALVVYEWALRGLGKFGWAAAFAYCACAALRLARFNTNIGVVDKRYFQGLPSPAAAALVAGFVWAADTFRYHGPELDWFAVAITALAAFTMVSDMKLLERQGHQPAPQRALHRHFRLRARLRGGVGQPAGRPVRPLRRVRAVRLCDVAGEVLHPEISAAICLSGKRRDCPPAELHLYSSS